MQKIEKRKINKQSGAAMLISIIFFLFISLAIISGLVSPSVREFKNANVNLNSKRSFFLAESGSEDAFYRLLKNKPIGTSETITLNSNSVTTNITTLVGGEKQITSLGDVSSYQRQLGIKLTAGAGVSFNYGVQVGTGGVDISSGSITGNVYSNGPITAGGSGDIFISGTAISAGTSGSIVGNSQWTQFHIGTVSGTAQAHTINYVDSTGLIYCQNGTGNNKSCTYQADPVPVDFPIEDESVTGWQDEAASGGTINGNYSVGWAGATLGPKKIVGNLTVNGGGILTVTGPLWVTGNVNLSGGGEIKLASNYGANDGIIVTDGTISVSGGGHATGSGVTGSYIMLLTTSSSNNAASVTGGSGALIVYAANGTISLSGGVSIKEAVGKRLTISGNSNVTYESGLINNNFSSGPGGAWVVSSWGEK